MTWFSGVWIIRADVSELSEDGTNSVPKRRYMKFRRRGITQNKEQNIINLVGNYHGNRSVFPISLVNSIPFGNFNTNVFTVHLNSVTLAVRQRPFHANVVTAALALMNRSDSTRLVSWQQLTADHYQLSQLLPPTEADWLRALRGDWHLCSNTWRRTCAPTASVKVKQIWP